MNGEEWLVTLADTETHTLSVYEQLVAVVDVITLNSRQYCVIIDPVAEGKPQLGRKVRRDELLGILVLFLIDFLETRRRRKILLPPTR